MKIKKIYLVLIISSIFLFETYKAESVTISAAQSGNWSSTSTWTGGVVPGALDTVKILVDAAVTITIDIDVTVARIELGAGSTMAKKDILILDTDKTLTVTGDFVWNKVGVFQQNAGSSVTAANYVIGTSGAGYSMAGWNINGIVNNRASVHGTGNIVAAAPTLPPVQQINWQYADFDITGYVALPLKNAWDANAYSSLNIDHCYFNATGYVDIGQYANAANNLIITNSDFRNTTSTLSGFNAHICIRTAAISSLGNFAFEGNTISGATMGKAYFSTVGNGREIKGNVFNNRSCDVTYPENFPLAQRTIKVYNNVFCATTGAGSVNGQLLDPMGGLEIYDNIFMGQPYNVHTIMFTGNYAADLPVTKIHHNVFDIDDGDSDVLNLNYVPVEITGNIFIGNGTPINLGVSGGGGYGSLSPNSGTVLAKNNTSYLSASIGCLAWAGETSQHTGGAVTFLNNLVGDFSTSSAKPYKDSQGTLDLFDYVDYNWFYNGNGGTNDNYENINKPDMTEGVTEGFGRFDQAGDPQFAHPERRMNTFDAYLGGMGTITNLVAEMLKKNQNVSGEVFNSSYSVAACLQYIRQGFVPGNFEFAASGQGGTYIGAIDFNYTTNTWTGASSSNWNTPGNWSANVVPTAAYNVTIPNVTNDPVVNELSASPAVCHNLTIQSDAVLTIAPGKALSVNGTLTNNAGTTGLLIQSASDASAGTGSLQNNTAGVLATVERWMSGNYWHLISPTATGQTVAEFVADAANSIASKPTTTQNYALAPYRENDNNWDYFKTTGAEGSFDAVGKGYQILRNANGIVSFKGTLAGADQSIPIIKTGYGWNLIGNPYSCAMDVKLFLENLLNIAAINQSYRAIYVADITNTETYGYIPLNYSTDPELIFKLASGEGFFVKSASASGTVNFTTAMKSHTSDAFKSTTIPSEIQLIAEISSEKLCTSVKYISEMTKGLDPGWDAGLFDGSGTSAFSLYTRLIQDNGVNFTIQCLPDNDYDNLIVPVGVVAQSGDEITFKAEAMSLPVDYKVYLEDKFTGKYIRLDEPGSNYNVKLENASTGTGRFYLHTKQNITTVNPVFVEDIKVIPMPQYQLIRVSGFVTLPAHANVYDLNGRIVASKSLDSMNENDIPLKQVSNGIYLVQIKSDKATTQRKISWTNSK